MTYSCFSGCPTGLVINASTGAVTWTPSYTDAGSYSVVVQASDGKSSVTDAFDITVNNTNRPPVLNSFASATALDSQNFAVTAVASDADGQSLAFSCIAGCPAGLFFTGNQLNWTPTADQIGAHNITVQVSDGTDTDAETISVTVYKRPVAVLSGLPVPINTMNESITVTVSGQEVVEYRYAFRSDGSNCSGYGAWPPISTPINENLGAEGLKRLCVYGRNAAGLSPSVPTEVALVKLKNLTTSPGLNVDGEVFDMTLHPDGDLLIVGDFDTYGGDMTHTKLLFVKPTGEIDSNFQSLGGSEVNALAVDSSNRIYVGGSFNRYGNTTVSNFMRLLPDGTLDPAFPPNSTTFIDGTVDAIALNGDESRIFLFGWFDRLGSDIRPGILCLTPAGVECPGFTLKTPADVPFTDFSYDPYLGAVHPTTGDVFAVAWQSTVGGVSVRKIVKFDSDGTMDATFTSNLGTGFSNDVNAIAMVPGQNLLLVGTESGNLNGMNGTLFALNLDGTINTAFHAGMGSGTGGCSACVHGLAGVSHGPHANKIYVSGDYCNFDGLSSRRGLIRLNSDGTLDSSFPANISVSGGPFTQMSISPENGILQGGGYTDAIAGVGTGGYLVFDQNDDVSKNDARNHLMLGNTAEVKATAFVFNGTEWLSVIGGSWGGRGGQYSGSVVKIDPETGELDQDFAARVPISWGVSTVEIGGTAPNQKIYVGGWFDGTFGTPDRLDGLMRLNLNGSLDTTWKLTPNADAHYYMDVYSMEYHNGKLWVGYNPNGQTGYEIFTTQGLFRVDDNGVIDTTFSNGTLFGHSSYGDLEINTIEWNPVANCMLVGAILKQHAWWERAALRPKNA